MKRLFIVLACSLFLNASSAFAQCPGFPQRGVEIIELLYNPALAQGSDDQRRELTRTFIEQLAFEFPNDGWVWKSADPGRPPSKDSIARIVGTKLCNWDWQNGGTRQRAVVAGQTGDDITGQNPIRVPGINHLTNVPSPQPGPVPTPTPMPAAVDLSQVYLKLDNLYAQAERIFAAQEAEYAARNAQLDLLNAQVQQHILETHSFISKVGGFFTDGKTIAAIVAGVGTYLGTQAGK